MIRVNLYDDADTLSELHSINQLCKKTLKSIMDSNFCHVRSESCNECKFKTVCFDIEELEVWSLNAISQIEDIYASS